MALLLAMAMLLCLCDRGAFAVAYVVMKCPYDNGTLLGVHEGQDGKPVLNGANQVSFRWGSVG